MRILTLNVNGLRSAASKGLMPWLRRERPDVVCLQEIKAQEADLPRELLAPRGYHAFFHPAEKRGYSGVALYARREPDRVVLGLGIPDIDSQGRYLQADFGALSIVSVYVPSGASGEAAQARKFAFLAHFLPHLEALRASGREVVLCGDWNIAHRAIDLKNWRSNQKNSGFLPEERAWLTDVLDRVGWVDVFRRLDARPDRYTWWSNRGQAWAKNVGWRIDYQITTPGIAQQAERARIYTAQRYSDHAPLIIDYRWSD